MKKFLCLLFLVPIFSTVCSAQLSQTQTSLGVDPVIVEAILDKGVPLQRQILITNLSNLPLPIKTLKQSFTPKEKLDISEEQLKNFDASAWLTISEKDTDFILQPHEVKKVSFTITQPADSAPGGHYASLIFEPLVPQEIISDQSVYVYARVAVLLFLQTKGDIVQNLETVSVNHKSIFEDNHLAFKLTLKNSGNTHLQPTGKINIYDDIKNELIGSANITSTIILPGTEKDFPVELTAGGLVGKYSVETIINYGSEGKYISTSRETFYVFPYRLSLFIILPSVVFLVLAIVFRGRLNKALHVLLFDAYLPGQKQIRTKLKDKIKFTLRSKRNK